MVLEEEERRSHRRSTKMVSSDEEIVSSSRHSARRRKSVHDKNDSRKRDSSRRRSTGSTAAMSTDDEGVSQRSAKRKHKKKSTTTDDETSMRSSKHHKKKSSKKERKESSKDAEEAEATLKDSSKRASRVSLTSTSTEEQSSKRSKKKKKKKESSKKKSREDSSTPEQEEEYDDVKQVGRASLADDSIMLEANMSTYAIPSAFSTPAEAEKLSKTASGGSGDAMFTVRGGKDVSRRWDAFSGNAKTTGEDDFGDSFEGSNQFSINSSNSSGFSIPAAAAMQRRSSRGLISQPAARPGAHYETSDRIQDMLDRKFREYDGQEEEVSPEAVPGTANLVTVGAHQATAVPDRIQSVLDRKFGDGTSASAAKGTVQDPVAEKMQSFQPSFVAHSSRATKEKLKGEDDLFGDEDPERGPDKPTAAMTFAAWNYGKGDEKQFIAAPTPDVLTRNLMDDQEFALSGVERKEMRLSAGLCPQCGRTKTHEKIKYGPFQAFRRMEPLTTPGHVYKGYCLFCNNILDLRRHLHEPYLREQDITGEDSVAPAQEAAINAPQAPGEPPEERTDWKRQRIQCCLCIAIIAVVAGVVGLIVTFTSTKNMAPAGGAVADVAPTPAPGPLGWHQIGSDISETVSSFGYKVSVSSDGTRVAVSSPQALEYSGRADVYEFDEETQEWVSLGLPILGDFENDQTGYGMDISDDGRHVIVGSPGNEKGFVRVFKYKDLQWQQVGGALLGETSAGWFGASVAINPDGTWIVVGAPYDTNEIGPEAGRARVYQLLNGQWTQVGSDMFGKAAMDQFGVSVAISDTGEIVAIGAPNSDDRWEDGGQIHMFKLEDKDGNLDYVEPLDQMKILGEAEAHGFGASISMNGHGHTVVSSSVEADADDGTEGGGDPRAMYVSFLDNSAEELGYGFPAIPGTIGLGYAMDIDLDGTKVIASTLNYNGSAGKAMVYDIKGKANWFSYPEGQYFGGEDLGPVEWLGDGPSVSISTSGSFVSIGYENIVIDNETEARSAVRVYYYGHGEA